jgi:hypothetical protein
MLDLSATSDAADQAIVARVLSRRFGSEGRARTWLADFPSIGCSLSTLEVTVLRACQTICDCLIREPSWAKNCSINISRGHRNRAGPSPPEISYVTFLDSSEYSTSAAAALADFCYDDVRFSRDQAVGLIDVRQKSTTIVSSWSCRSTATVRLMHCLARRSKSRNVRLSKPTTAPYDGNATTLRATIHHACTDR